MLRGKMKVPPSIPAAFSILFLVAINLWTVEGQIGVTVDAAYTSDKYLFLVSDGRLMYIDKSSRTEVYTLQYFHIFEQGEPESLDVKSAVTVSEDMDLTVLFYGSQHGLDVEFGPFQQEVKDKLIYCEQEPCLVKGGPDAAARKGAKVYLFKDCEMVARMGKDSWGEVEKVEPYGLPCHVDAAWNDGSGMFVLKGDQIWRWNEDGTVSARKPFKSVYTTWSWFLNPSKDE